MPEIRNPNLESQGPGGGGASGGDFRSLILFIFLALAGVMVYQYFQKPAANAPANQAQQTQQESQSAQQAPSSSRLRQQESDRPRRALRVQLPRSALRPRPPPPSRTRSSGSLLRTRAHRSSIGYSSTTPTPAVSRSTWCSKTPRAFRAAALAFHIRQCSDHATQHGALSGIDTGQVLAPNSVSFHYAAGGLDVVKTFTFDTSYVIGVHVNVKQNGEPVRALVTWPAGLGDMEEFTAQRGRGAVAWCRPSHCLHGRLTASRTPWPPRR